MNAMYTGGMDIGNHSSRVVWGCLKGNITVIKWSVYTAGHERSKHIADPIMSIHSV